jgi:hypothetical protein
LLGGLLHRLLDREAIVGQLHLAVPVRADRAAVRPDAEALVDAVNEREA